MIEITTGILTNKTDEQLETSELRRYAVGILDKTDFINWFEDIKNIVKVPKSKYIVLDYSIYKELLKASFDNNGDLTGFNKIVDDLDVWIIENIQYPIFLKSGVFSGKHFYSECCVCNNKSEIVTKFLANIYNSECVGCPISPTIVVRELLNISHSKFTAFDKMPVVREFRFFIHENKVHSYQEYWVKGAIEDHTNYENWEEELDKINSISETELSFLISETEKIRKEIGNDWSVDWLQDANGDWYCIDLADYNTSYIDKNRKLIFTAEREEALE